MDKTTIIALKGITHTYGEKTVLKGVDLEVKQGDFVAITGPNGGGKTTMLRLILHLLKPSEGEVAYFHHGVATDHLHFGYLPQKNAIDSQFPITVQEVIASGLKMRPLHRITPEEKSRIASTIDLMRLQEVSHRAIGTLSGGQLQRALLGRAIISQPSVLVLDEPLSYIDKQFEQHLYSIVKTLSATTTIILVSHEMSVISGMANRHIIIADGKIHECEAHHHFVKSECK
ncbi:MAG: ATP-binding cassette domain-containing protein [Bacteroidales bacterium]|nr:ATP-binding cassette domain-containing protein [Bacteroidales bacterium]